ncbi:uncharacterized protein LOC110679431 isoform X1 [Aedes aegypti]|uniref:Uncharacterized protein n=1 Tax=Aedes aegypti TaxID=7159 RepID=A0A6I8TT15_AEDAE|nr:uncharacterized protein LOC110679431 isoform X1 [Aedes aegypti]XP_021709674.1 uncharacterized protein LOC110679431 isoform X1 [Aedes aegypti]XP_021709675.1 uncharacterized protein LOC110679431 isoform X1 [Aedes aegypti]XP_021709676.1 uncharacterized protein LOC110679431 isoform X1 [Aedes aegypti]XP_021709677.1 uncharacterized protein LOC110679431 isoform X1 [Aedes aegypti]
MFTMKLRICVTLVSILLLALAVDPSLATTPQARRCYVCGEGADAPFRLSLAQAADESSSSRHPRPLGSLPNIVTTCEDFERDRNELDKYVLECPPAYTSCLTQVDGDVEVRTCGENLPINDCKSANKIDYCYCSVDLCNSLKRTQIRREIEDSQMGGLSEHLRQHHNSDDEDLTESSGMEDSHEKHRTISRNDNSNNHRVNQNGSNNNHHHSNDKSYETTQVVMTLKPISGSSERRNSSSEGGADSSAKSGSNSRWLVGFSSTRNGWVALVLIGASMWRFAQ